MDTTTVLVVSYDAAKRNQLEGWLQAAGFEVCGCPGPGVPVTCPQIRGRSCALAQEAGVVVLDLLLLGDFNKATAPGWVLLDTYLERGAQVVLLADPAGSPPVLDTVRCIVVPRNVDQRRLVATVQSAAASVRDMRYGPPNPGPAALGTRRPGDDTWTGITRLQSSQMLRISPEERN